MKLRGWAGALFCAQWLFASIAWAQQPRVEIDHCPHLASDRLRSILALELRTIGEDRDVSHVSVVVTCSESSTTIVARVGDERRRRAISGPVTALSDRDLALAASELIAEIWERPIPEAESREEVRAAPVKPETSRARTLWFFGEARRLRRPTRLLPGGGVGLSFSPATYVEFGAHAELMGGRVSTKQAFVRQLILSLHPRIRFGPSWNGVRLLFGASVPFGVVDFSPLARVKGATERRLTAGWLAVAADVGAELPVGRRFVLLPDIYGGVVLVPVRGLVDGASVVELSGPMFGARLGLGLTF